MENSHKKITIDTVVDAPIDKVWKYWTTPEDIIRWNNASEDWHTPHAENDLRAGGKFLARMEAKDGSSGFDFEGKYDSVVRNKSIHYTIADGRKVTIDFLNEGNKVKVVQTFDAEDTHSPEVQSQGWQSILDNFKKYTEEN